MIDYPFFFVFSTWVSFFSLCFFWNPSKIRWFEPFFRVKNTKIQRWIQIILVNPESSDVGEGMKPNPINHWGAFFHSQNLQLLGLLQPPVILVQYDDSFTDSPRELSLRRWKNWGKQKFERESPEWSHWMHQLDVDLLRFFWGQAFGLKWRFLDGFEMPKLCSDYNVLIMGRTTIM